MQIVQNAYDQVHALCGGDQKTFPMTQAHEKWEVIISTLREIQAELKAFTAVLGQVNEQQVPTKDYVYTPFRGSEIYLLHKAFLDAGGAPHDNFKTLLEKTLTGIANKTQRGFSSDSIYKCSDKVSPESKDNVKRFLQRMIRNIDSYD